MAVSLPFRHAIGAVIVALVFVCLSHRTSAYMEITAYEYKHKFGNQPQLGDCVERDAFVALPDGSGKRTVQRLKTPYLKKRGTITSESSNYTETNNILITSPEDIVQYLELCPEDVATYLGLLHGSDCVAVDIASKLLFDDKTVIRASVNYYMHSVDMLEEREDHYRGLEEYLKDKYYLKSRSYGTMEIVLVEMRFKSSRKAAAARSIQLRRDHKMSSYMAIFQERNLKPKSVTVIGLSTASNEPIKVERFKEWPRAVREVQLYEIASRHYIESIASGQLKRPLKYILEPFIPPPNGIKKGPRMAKTLFWKKMSLFEAELRGCYIKAKKWNKKCRKEKLDRISSLTKLCRRIRRIKSTLSKTRELVHLKRAEFETLSNTDREKVVKRYTTTVQTQCQATNQQTEKVRRMRKKMKKTKKSKKSKKGKKKNKKSSGKDDSFLINNLTNHRIRHGNRKRNNLKDKTKKPKQKSLEEILQEQGNRKRNNLKDKNKKPKHKSLEEILQEQSRKKSNNRRLNEV